MYPSILLAERADGVRADCPEEVVVFISLQQLEQRPVRFDVDIPAGEIDLGGDLTQVGSLHAEGTAQLLSRSLEEIRVEGDLRVEVAGICDRCLEAVTLPVQHHFDLTYVPARDAAGGEEEIKEAGIDVGFYEGSGLALNDVLREAVLLVLPMQLICEEACKGICPVCGQNRNQRDCDCHSLTVDDRWSGLRELRAENAQKN